ncbi:molybdenum cofactor guanylyltransferase [Paenibacillus puerhi]|uniref:molybdenum cofactor guanylyltransferase n=1 Tax=Paenibacillus puerhi TaxID=2692622 RepID=UPI00135CF138|nr:molybdenum cofactor guanylyltransferase [Paenibacillus puerhi]
MRQRGELTGVIIAGGLNTRMGRIKGLVPFPDEPLILRTIERMREACGELLLVTNDPAAYTPVVGQAVTVIADRIPHKGPMSGLHAALAQSDGSFFWAVGSDMPFISASVAQWMLKRLHKSGAKAAVPLIGGQLHPLHGVYLGDCLPSLEQTLHTARTGLVRWLGGIEADMPTEKDFTEAGLSVRCVDSFNNPHDYARCLEQADWQ